MSVEAAGNGKHPNRSRGNSLLLPPAQAHGIATAMIAGEYQAGPASHIATGLRNAQGTAHDAKRQAVLHGSIGREPRRGVASRDAVDNALGRRQQEECVGPRPAERREALLGLSTICLTC